MALLLYLSVMAQDISYKNLSVGLMLIFVLIYVVSTEQGK
jgi:hypothetical protein